MKLHDEQSEGLSRRLCINMVQTAGGGTLTHSQATNIWDKTVLPLGKRLGLLTGYVKPQEGTSKRTASGNEDLQRKWHETVTEMIAQIKSVAKKELNDNRLVKSMLPRLIVNLDEECLHALGKNSKVVGSSGKRKHNNQNASSRQIIVYYIVSLVFTLYHNLFFIISHCAGTQLH